MSNEFDAVLLLLFLAFMYLVFVTTMYPHIENFMRSSPPETKLAGSDRGSYRDYWDFPELYDQQTGYACACHKKNRFYREGRCWEFYERGGKGLGFNPMKACK